MAENYGFEKTAATKTARGKKGREFSLSIPAEASLEGEPGKVAPPLGEMNGKYLQNFKDELELLNYASKSKFRL